MKVIMKKGFDIEIMEERKGSSCEPQQGGFLKREEREKKEREKGRKRTDKRLRKKKKIK